jgi:hypothetical protein
MRSKDQRRQMVRRGRIVRILAIVACAISTHQPSQAQSAPRGKQPAQRPPAAAGTTATGCLRDVSDLGGQGGGGAAWQGSVSGHVLIDVRAVADKSGSASSQAGAGPATSLLLIRGIPDAELRRFRGQQVEVRGTMASAGEGGRSGGGLQGNEGQRAPSTPNGKIAGEPDGPAVGTGGSLRVRPSEPSRAAGAQAPPEFQATSIRAIARTCPTGAR